MRSPFMPKLGEHFEHLAFEGMVWTGHSHLRRKVSEAGSLSEDSSTALRTIS